MAKKQIVFVYHDMDHGDMEAFTTLEKAIAHAKECWGEDTEITPYSDDEDCDVWGDDNYIHIKKLEIK